MANKSSILVVGGAGYIGSHFIIELGEKYPENEIIVIDNLSNSSIEMIPKIKSLLNDSNDRIKFIKLDIREMSQLNKLFQENSSISMVIHFAGLKSVKESSLNPIDYYDNNVLGSINLIKSMQKFNIKSLVFSSSATVYGESPVIPIPESQTISPINPYGYSKYFVEQILKDLYASDNEWNIAVLRYFNPIGAHESGVIGENPLDTPNNLLPIIANNVINNSESLKVFGNDYNTSDGTPIRDYIHIKDLVVGHIKAMEFIKTSSGYNVWNLGTGKGSTVMEIINEFSKSCGELINYEIVGRRVGDVENLTADVEKAKKDLNWRAELSISTACDDLWRWTCHNNSVKSSSSSTMDISSNSPEMLLKNDYETEIVELQNVDSMDSLVM